MQPYFYGAEFYRAGELREIDIGSCYLAEIRAAQTDDVSHERGEIIRIDHSEGRRLSA